MDNFSSMRRDFLRFGSAGIVATAITAVPFASSQETAAASQGLYDVRKYGATGDGKTLDTDAVNRAIEAASAADAKPRTRRSNRPAMRGVPRARRAISLAPSGVMPTLSTRAPRVTIFSSSCSV